MKQLMAVTAWEFTGDEIGKLRKLNNGFTKWYEHLPKYTLNTITGEIVEVYYYLQFIEFGEEKYLLFDIPFISNLLSEELGGGVDFIEKIDFRPIFSKFNKHNFEEYHRMIPNMEYLVFDLIYSQSGWEVTEYNLEMNLVGYLDSEMTLIKMVD